MILAGDEFGRTQTGNNNAYCQDNTISWIDWDKLDTERTFCDFVRRVLKLRSSCDAFRRTEFLHGKTVGDSSLKDIAWLLPNGREMSEADWSRSNELCLGVQYTVLDGNSPEQPSAYLLLMNASDRDVTFSLPAIASRLRWRCLLNTIFEEGTPRELVLVAVTFVIEGRSLALLATTVR